MSKHTPGPWSYFQERHSSMAINQWWIDGGNRKALALLQVMDLNHSETYRHEHPTQVAEWHETLEEVEANARLIAAAPEMLEALEEAARWLDNDGDYTLNDTLCETKYDCVRVILAAIAKAKGETL